MSEVIRESLEKMVSVGLAGKIRGVIPGHPKASTQSMLVRSLVTNTTELAI